MFQDMMKAWGSIPLYGLYRYVRPQRVWFFLTVLVRDKVSSLVVLFSSRVWILKYCLEFVFCFFRSYLLFIINETKALYNAFNIGLNYATNYETGLKGFILGSGLK